MSPIAHYVVYSRYNHCDIVDVVDVVIIIISPVASSSCHVFRIIGLERKGANEWLVVAKYMYKGINLDRPFVFATTS